MKKRLLSAGVVLAMVVLVLTACSKGTPQVKTSSKNAKDKQVEKTKDESSSGSNEKKAPEVGKRSNPVPLGTTATFKNDYFDIDSDDSKEVDAAVSVTLSNVIRGDEAYKYLVQQNQFNEAAPDGQEWMILDVNLTLDKGDPDRAYYVSPSFDVIDSSGSEVDQKNYGTFGEGMEFGNVKIFEGGNASGKIAKLVPVGDENLLLEFSDDANVFFAVK